MQGAKSTMSSLRSEVVVLFIFGYSWFGLTPIGQPVDHSGHKDSCRCEKQINPFDDTGLVFNFGTNDCTSSGGGC